MDQTYTNQLNRIFNYDNVFIRNVGLALCKTWTKNIRWINRFENGEKIRVVMPFYFSMTGDERFILDTFVDDTVDRRVELNTDQIPRGVMIFQGASLKSTEFANPNQYLGQKADINSEMKNIISKVKAVPVICNYNVEIKLASERDVEVCYQKIWDCFFNYEFFRLNYYGMPIDAYFRLPDDKSVEIIRTDDQSTERYKKMSFSLAVDTYYPVFKVNIDDLEVCSNDDDLDWNALGVPRPTEDFCNTLEAYYKSAGQEGVSCNFNRVFWKAYYYNLKDFPATKPTNIKLWQQENL